MKKFIRLVLITLVLVGLGLTVMNVTSVEMTAEKPRGEGAYDTDTGDCDFLDGIC